MKEIQKTVYIAEDGREFSHKEDCERHERRLKEDKKIIQKYHDIIDFCSAHYKERDDEGYIWCDCTYCPFYDYDCAHHCCFDCIPCTEMKKIGTE